MLPIPSLGMGNILPSIMYPHTDWVIGIITMI